MGLKHTGAAHAKLYPPDKNIENCVKKSYKRQD